MRIDQFVSLQVRRDEGLDRGGNRQRHERAGDAQQRAAHDGRSERERRVERHRPLGYLRRYHVVLHLLVENYEPQHPGCLQRALQQGDENRKDPSEVRSEHRDELGDDADPDRQWDGEGNADDGQHDPGNDRRYRGQQRPRVEVAPGLVDRNLDYSECLALAVRRQHGEHYASEPGALGREVEREEPDREQLEERVHQAAADSEQRTHRVAGDSFERKIHGGNGFVDPRLGELDVEP